MPFSESLPQRKHRARKIIRILEEMYPEAKCALHFETVFQLLVAVILSAQCTDKQVNKVTPHLFSVLPTAAAFAAAPLAQIEMLIRSTGFYKNKARNIQAAAQKIMEEYDGHVPDTMEDLLKLPGVGRKTANVILETGFGKVEGIVVDTHVNRITTQRLQLVSPGLNAKAEKIEAELQKIIPRKNWGALAHLLIFHGREICIARKPKCAQCPLVPLCPGNEL